MADFSGLASVMAVQKDELAQAAKPVNKTHKKTLDLPNSSNSKVSMKLLQILKDNQDELLNEEEQLMAQQQLQNNPLGQKLQQQMQQKTQMPVSPPVQMHFEPPVHMEMDYHRHNYNQNQQDGEVCFKKVVCSYGSLNRG
jgi:hypothetical protein